jgi:hypothetical protein
VRGKGQAKSGDELFWEEKFHAANGKAQAHTECGALKGMGEGGGATANQELSHQARVDTHFFI